MVVAANEELQLIPSLDDTDDKDDQASPSIRQSTNSCTVNEVNELISVLERISSSMIKAEAVLAKAILLNTHGKELFTALDCFVSPFVEAFRQCNDCVQNVKNDSIRAIKFERVLALSRYMNNRSSNLTLTLTLTLIQTLILILTQILTLKPTWVDGTIRSHFGCSYIEKEPNY